MINKNDTSALEKANKLFKHFESKNIDTIIDDTDENLSSKIKKFNLIGIPFQIMIGNKTEENSFEFKELNENTQNISLEKIIKIIKNKKK